MCRALQRREAKEQTLAQLLGQGLTILAPWLPQRSVVVGREMGALGRCDHFSVVALGEVICCRSSHLLCALKVHYVQFRLRGPAIGSLHDTCNKVHATPFVSVCVCTTECDRLRSAPVYIQCQSRMTPIPNEANLFKCD